MAAFIDTGTSASCFRWRVYTSTAYHEATGATAAVVDFKAALYNSVRESIQRVVHEILYPRNWRWFHAFARPVEIVRAMADEPRRETQRRAQERFPAAEARARKRRAWLEILRGAR